MKQYFEKMDPLGKALSPKQIDSMKAFFGKKKTKL